MVILVRIFLSGFILVGILFSGFKIYSFLSQSEFKNNHTSTKQNQNQKNSMEDAEKPFWKKEFFIVPTHLWKVRTDQTDLHEGDSYFLIEQTNTNYTCILGRFKLYLMMESKLMFQGEKKPTSRLEKFALAQKKTLSVSLLSESQISLLPVLLSCHEWFHVQHL